MTYYLKNIANIELYVPQLKKTLAVGEIIEVDDVDLVTHLTAMYNGLLLMVSEDEYKKSQEIKSQIETIIQEEQTDSETTVKKRGRPKKSEQLETNQ